MDVKKGLKIIIGTAVVLGGIGAVMIYFSTGSLGPGTAMGLVMLSLTWGVLHVMD